MCAAAAARSNASDSANPHDRPDRTSAQGWRQQAETVSGSCSPRSVPGEPPSQQWLQAQHEQQQHNIGGPQQPCSSSTARPDSGGAAAHVDALPSQNRRLRAAVAEAQAERDEALAQARGVRREVDELNRQVGCAHLI
jgi:hypothetical protein